MAKREEGEELWARGKKNFPVRGGEENSQRRGSTKDPQL